MDIGLWCFYVLIFLATTIALIYGYFQYKFMYWKRRGFPSPLKPVFPFGNFSGLNTKHNMDLALKNIYAATPNERFLGCYIFSKPIVLMRDLELVKSVLIKDFSSFHDRGIELKLKNDPLAAHLFMLNGQEWRNLRIKLTPAFTTGKMRMMFPTLIEIGKELENVLDEATNLENVELKEIFSRYTVDVVSSVAFGIVTNTLKNPNHEIRNMFTTITKPNFWFIIINAIILTCPKLLEKWPLRIIPKHLSDYFINIVKETMDYRIENNIHRNDFMQLLLQLKTLGYVKDADSFGKDELTDSQQKFSVEQAAAQAFIFYIAGFETSSATIQFACYELALNPDLQTKVQEEIISIAEQNTGALTFDNLQKMELLDRVLSETLRKYPISSFLMRKCNSEYQIPESDLKLLPGDSIWFSIYGCHHDPQYYPNPEKFDPDRFLPEIKETRPSFAYQPFGEGPRSCIGNRFALMQIKTALAIILSRYTFSPSKETQIPIEFNPKAGFILPKGKVHLKISRKNP